jgi:hypothetical protein
VLQGLAKATGVKSGTLKTNFIIMVYTILWGKLNTRKAENINESAEYTGSHKNWVRDAVVCHDASDYTE